MDHVVYLDASAKELEGLLSGVKTAIIRGATGRKMPHGRVNTGDVLYFINNNGEGLVRARGTVTAVVNSERLSPAESIQLVEAHQGKLQLTPKQKSRWAGKRYLVVIEVGDIAEIEAFRIDKSRYSNMDDWLPVGDIKAVCVR
jgi:hypothetical protein